MPGIDRGVVAPTDRVRWVRLRLRAGWLLGAVLIGIVAAVNLYLATRSISAVVGGAAAVDWLQYVEASGRLSRHGELYAVTDTYAYHYSPLFAATFGVLAPMGVVAWRVLHVAGALALPSWPLRLLTLASWPFWYDVETGNVLTFVLLAAAWALRDSRLASAAYLVLVLLIPRPLMLPVAAWLLWQQAGWRLPFAVLFIVHAAAVAALGWAVDWGAALVAAGGDVGIPSNIGPSRFIGTLPWLVVGLPLAVWLTSRGRVGLASLAASPYWLPYYLLMPLLDLVAWRLSMPARRHP
jgi:hypothetical protein